MEASEKMDNWRFPYQKVIICGGRNAAEQSCGEVLEEFISRLRSDCVVIHGGCKGIDTIAGKYAKQRGLTVIVFPAEWNKYGRSAGMIRNEEMLEQSPDFVVGFHPELSQSKGTKNMIDISNKKGVRTMWVKI